MRKEHSDFENRQRRRERHASLQQALQNQIISKSQFSTLSTCESKSHQIDYNIVLPPDHETPLKHLLGRCKPDEESDSEETPVQPTLISEPPTNTDTESPSSQSSLVRLKSGRILRVRHQRTEVLPNFCTIMLASRRTIKVLIPPKAVPRNQLEQSEANFIPARQPTRPRWINHTALNYWPILATLNVRQMNRPVHVVCPTTWPRPQQPAYACVLAYGGGRQPPLDQALLDITLKISSPLRSKHGNHLVAASCLSATRLPGRPHGASVRQLHYTHLHNLSVGLEQLCHMLVVKVEPTVIAFLLCSTHKLLQGQVHYVTLPLPLRFLANHKPPFNTLCTDHDNKQFDMVKARSQLYQTPNKAEQDLRLCHFMSVWEQKRKHPRIGTSTEKAKPLKCTSTGQMHFMILQSSLHPVHILCVLIFNKFSRFPGHLSRRHFIADK
ncbi:hypothetical protein PR048_001354 [Dryococelus australis]|uniref:Uncharacterized protein n=1 Tax=Dryococelus australis TaxID=614101 RepID=A0ABQ9IH38_9NEOP|nr:hypothetical protein PR048_001354 [Dryococelus australis]